MTYKEAIIESLKALGGHAYYRDIYEKFSEIYDGELTKTWKKSIQSVIERLFPKIQYGMLCLHSR